MRRSITTTISSGDIWSHHILDSFWDLHINQRHGSSISPVSGVKLLEWFWSRAVVKWTAIQTSSSRASNWMCPLISSLHEHRPYLTVSYFYRKTDFLRISRVCSCLKWDNHSEPHVLGVLQQQSTPQIINFQVHRPAVLTVETTHECQQLPMCHTDIVLCIQYYMSMRICMHGDS